QFLGLLLADVRLECVVLVNHFDWQAPDFSSHMIEREFERIAHVIANGCRRATESTYKPDFDSFLLSDRRRGCKCQRKNEENSSFRHRTSLCTGSHMKRGVFPLFSVFTKLCLSCRQKPITPDSIKFVIRTNEQSFFTMFCLHEKDFNTAP